MSPWTKSVRMIVAPLLLASAIPASAVPPGGKVESVSPLLNRLSVGGVEYRLTSQTQVRMQDGTPRKLSDLQPGAKAIVETRADSLGNQEITRITIFTE